MSDSLPIPLGPAKSRVHDPSETALMAITSRAKHQPRAPGQRPSRSSMSNCSWRRRARASSSSRARAFWAGAAAGRVADAYPSRPLVACPARRIAASAAAALAALRCSTLSWPASLPKVRPEPSNVRKASPLVALGCGGSSPPPVMEVTDFLTQLPMPLRLSPTAEAASPIFAPVPLAISDSRSPTPAGCSGAWAGALGSSAPLPRRPPPQFWLPICRTLAASLQELQS
mmetsp:Transcript_11676/g.22217  ORF Transcript_11676/g.22217 Transcript_11676/m.22217 type:complete len:229 (-) Transcript_11676:347-1033(-)